MIHLLFQGGFIYAQDQNQKARKDVLVQLRYVQKSTLYERLTPKIKYIKRV